MDKERILKLAEFGDNPELTQFETLLDIQQEVDELEEGIEEKLAMVTEKICNDIYAIPKPIDYSQELKDIKEKLNEEVVVTLNIV